VARRDDREYWPVTEPQDGVIQAITGVSASRISSVRRAGSLTAGEHHAAGRPTMQRTADFYFQDVAAPIVVAGFFILATSRFKEPNRRHFMAIMIAGAGAAYLSGGFGAWEFAFTALVTVCAYKGLNSYRLVGLGWVFHTTWDVLHHLFGNPIIPFLPASSPSVRIWLAWGSA
jgi:hypothetical protein